MKRIELLINEEEENFGVEALSLVKFPAIEANFIFFKKDEMLSLAAVDEDRRTLIGPALIPNKNIPRYDDVTAEEYEVYFSEDTVKRASELFLKQNRTNKHTFEHEVDVEAVHVVESWIVDDPEVDKAKHYGMNVPKGTWMVRVDVSNDDMWAKVKDDEIRGFSIEGYFVDKVEHMAKRPIADKSVMSMLKSIFNKLMRRDLYSELLLSNGKTLITESEKFEPGSKVQILDDDGNPGLVDDGSYTSSSGTELAVFESVLVEFDGETEETEEAESGETVEHWKQVISDKLNMGKRKLSAVSELQGLSIFIAPVDRYSSVEGRYFYPWKHSNFDAYVSETQDYFTQFPQIDEWEAVDADFDFGRTSMNEGVSEETWNEFKAFADLATSFRIRFYDILEASSHFGDADVDYLEEAYSGHYDSLREMAVEMVDEGLFEGDSLERYFDWEQFGRDLWIGGDFDYMMDEDPVEYERIGDMRDAERGEYFVFEQMGSLSELGAKTLKDYVDSEKLGRDLGYDYTLISGIAWRSH